MRNPRTPEQRRAYQLEYQARPEIPCDMCAERAKTLRVCDGCGYRYCRRCKAGGAKNLGFCVDCRE